MFFCLFAQEKTEVRSRESEEKEKMEESKKEGRYGRIYKQLSELVLKSNNAQARMATIVAVLHHKMENFFWAGFYMIYDGKMTVNI